MPRAFRRDAAATARSARGPGAQALVGIAIALAMMLAGSAAAQPREHLVAPGDTLYGLADRYDVTVDELRRLNDLVGDLLRVGQTLRLPGPAGWTTADVPVGRDWNDLAATLGRSATTLRAANPTVTDPGGATVRVPPHDGPLAAPLSGEDLLAFAARAGTAPAAVVARNGLEPPYRLDPTEPLLLPEGAATFGATAAGAEAGAGPGAAGGRAAPSGAEDAPPAAASRDVRPAAAEAHASLRLTALRSLPDALAGVVLRPPDDGFAWPLTSRPRITSRFGWRNVSVGGNRYHQGLDLGAPTGTPVLAAREGTVRRTGWIGAYGYAVYVRHDDGFETRYAHLSRIDVAPGESVRKGTRLGAVGTTGASTGPHLHFEVRRDGTALDPLTVLPGRDGERIAAR